MNDLLGDRMKGYENISRIYLPRRMPVIIRVDGRAFHTFTRGFARPFDLILHRSIWGTAETLCKEISGVKLAYIQSDEISLFLTNDDTIDTQPWFDNNIQKLVSISASIATLAFNTCFSNEIETLSSICEELKCEDKVGLSQLETYRKAVWKAQFDSRAFVLPKEEVVNYFIWRQQDATRNSVQMVARSLYSHKELMNKNTDDLREMIFQKGINWNDYDTPYKRGVCWIKKPRIVASTVDLCSKVIEPAIRNQWTLDDDIPIFTQDRSYIEKLVTHDD